MQKILITAGGTGGHVIPALTVAQALLQENNKVFWLGTAKGLEAKLVPEANIPLYFITRVPVRGKSIKTLIVTPWRLLCALAQAFRVIRKLNPDVVVGMGGFVSFPGGLVAKLLRKRLIIHEQNAVAGLANRLLAKFADVRLQAFPNVFEKGVTIGNPIRPNIVEIASPLQRFSERRGRLRLFIMGGSQGSVAINETVTKAIANIAPERRPDVWHIAGEGKTEEVEKAYQSLGLSARVDGFVSDLKLAYEWADIVIARSGALTVSELACAGVGSILVPFPHSVDDHQILNAKFLEEVSAAIVILQSNFTPEKLTELLEDCMKSRSKLLSMAKCARSVAKPDATEKVLNCCA